MMEPITVTTFESRLSEMRKGVVPMDPESIWELRRKIRNQTGFSGNRDDAKM